MICLAIATKVALLSQTFCYIEQVYYMAYTQGASPMLYPAVGMKLYSISSHVYCI